MTKTAEAEHTRRKASDTVRVAVTLPGAKTKAGPVKCSDQVTVTGQGKYTISARFSRNQYEKTFGTTLSRHRLPFVEGQRRHAMLCRAVQAREATKTKEASARPGRDEATGAGLIDAGAAPARI
ncbi:MAG: hypothetical protein ABJI96_08935 [Paracoccaceae bacterium]